MNILWVEDFDRGKGARVAMTRQWLDTILCERVKERLTDLERNTMSDSVSFLSTLAENDSPIVWADSLASGLAAAALGTAACRGNKYSAIPQIRASYEVALLDLAIPHQKDGGQLSDVYSERAQALLDAEEKNGTFDLQDPGLKAFPGIILAMRLMQQGMPAERIFFLTANADVSSMPSSVKSMAGPEFLKKSIIAKTGIGDLLRRVENNAYYQLKTLIGSVSQDMLSIVEQAEFMGASRSEFDFKDSGEFLFERKEDTVLFLKELAEMLPLHVAGDGKSIYYNMLINKILIEFDHVKAPYIYSCHESEYIDSIPARFYARSLKYLRNINAHTSYLKHVTEREVGIVFLLFAGFISETYGHEYNTISVRTDMISAARRFFDNESILAGKRNDGYRDNDAFMHEVGCRYMGMLKEYADSSDEYRSRFINITADFPDSLALTAWDVLRLMFWSQVSFTRKSLSGFAYGFDFNTQNLRDRPLFCELGDRLALCEDELGDGGQQ